MKQLNRSNEKNDLSNLKIEGHSIYEEKMDRIAAEKFCLFLYNSMQKEVCNSPINSS